MTFFVPSYDENDFRLDAIKNLYVGVAFQSVQANQGRAADHVRTHSAKSHGHGCGEILRLFSSEN